MLDIPQPMLEPLLVERGGPRRDSQLQHRVRVARTGRRGRHRGVPRPADPTRGHAARPLRAGVRRRRSRVARTRPAVRRRARPRRHRVRHVQRRPHRYVAHRPEHPALDLQSRRRVRGDRDGSAASDRAVDAVDRRLGLRHGRRASRSDRRRGARTRSGRSSATPTSRCRSCARRRGTSTSSTPPPTTPATSVLRRRRGSPPSALQRTRVRTPPSRTRSTSPGRSRSQSRATPGRACWTPTRRNACRSEQQIVDPGQPVPARLRRAAGLVRPRHRRPGGRRAGPISRSEARRESHLRERLYEALQLKNTEFNAHGVELNQRYESGRGPRRPGGRRRSSGRATRSSTRRPPPDPARSCRTRGSSDVTGGESPRSTSSATGSSRSSPGLPVEPGRKRQRRSTRRGFGSSSSVPRVPLTCTASGGRLREIDEAGVLLVRPDGHIAWRHVEAVWDPDTAKELLADALFRLLGTEGVVR